MITPMSIPWPETKNGRLIALDNGYSPCPECGNHWQLVDFPCTIACFNEQERLKKKETP